MVKDMTEGKPLKLILSFCIPLIFGNLFQQMYNMVDSIIVGQFVGVDALAAVGATGSLNFLILGFVNGLCSGFSIPIAQSFGAGNFTEMRRRVANAFYLGSFVAFLVTVLTMLYTPWMLHTMQTPKDIYEDSYAYIIILFAGTYATMLYNLLAGFMRALGDSRTPLYFLAIASLLNIILDLLFILAFHMGVSGAAWATVISQGVSAILCLFYIRWKFRILRFEQGELRPSWRQEKRLLSISIPMALQFSITAIGSIVLQTAVNSLGSGVVAAVTAAGKIQIILVQPMETIGITMATFAGQNLGAGKIDRIRQGTRQSLLLAVGYSVFACLVVTFLGYYIALLFVHPEEKLILSQLQGFLRINGIFYPVLGLLFVLRNTLQGLGYGFLPMLAGVCEMTARSLVAFCLVGMFQFNAICFANPAAWFAADLLLIVVWMIKIRSLQRMQLERSLLQSLQMPETP